MFLVDADVLIECLRGSVAAKTWLTSFQKEAVGIPGVVVMELLMGCGKKSEPKKYWVARMVRLKFRKIAANGDTRGWQLA